MKDSYYQYTREQIDKVGNAIIYLTNHIQPLYKTKLLKLLYLLDESSVKKFGIPFLNLEYEVWQAGPVCSDIYQELDEQPNLLEDYITISFDEVGTKVSGKKPFNDDEFSDNDMKMLQFTVDAYKQREIFLTASFTEGTTIDFSIFVKGDTLKEQIYRAHQEYNLVRKSLMQ